MKPQFFFLSIFFFSLLSCNGYKIKRINLTGFSDQNEVIYETEKVRFSFSHNDIVEYCNKQDSNEHNNFKYKDLLNYLKNNQSQFIVIPDTLGTILERDSSFYYKGKYIDTLLRVRNSKNEFAWVTDAIRWTLIDIIKNGRTKIFDKQSNKLVDYIFIDEIETKSHGEVQILLPNKVKIFQQLRWIR